MQVGAGMSIATAVQTKQSESTGEAKQSKGQQEGTKQENSLDALLQDLDSAITAQQADTSRSIRG